MRTTLMLLITAVALLSIDSLLLAQHNDSAKTEPVVQAVSAQVADSAGVADSGGAAAALEPDPDTIFSPDDFVVVETRHRMYPNFSQIDSVKFHQRFQLGDENLFAEVFKFVADLKIAMSGEKVKMSDTLYNPAVQVRVVAVDTTATKDSLVQESWAFYYGGAPHFSRNAFFAFKLLDFKVTNPKYVQPPEGE